MNSQILNKKDQLQTVSNFSKYKLFYFFIFLQILITLYLSLAYTYKNNTSPSKSSEFSEETRKSINKLYPFFQDVNVMIFIGFGFLMTYLRSHSWSSVSFNLMLGAFSMEVGLIFLHFWTSIIENHWEKREIDISMLIKGDFVAGTVLITFGAVIGKFNMVQYLMMAFIEIIFATLNSTIGESVYKAVDTGGSMYIHLFGAYFGLALVMGCKYKANSHLFNSGHYNSNLFAMIGTIFLYMYWPSFNGALASGNGQQRIITNTVLSLSSSVMGVFLTIPFFRKGKLWMDNVLNSTVAGGVIIGASADLIPNPFIALILGFFGGILSSIGFQYIAPFLKNKINLQDTAGVHNLHGMPGLFAGIFAIIIIASSSKQTFKDNVGEYFEIDENRSSLEQAGFQAAALFTTIGISLLAGFFTGVFLSLDFFVKVVEQDLFDDKTFWFMEHLEVDQELKNLKGFFTVGSDIEEKELKNKEVILLRTEERIPDY